VVGSVPRIVLRPLSGWGKVIEIGSSSALLLLWLYGHEDGGLQSDTTYLSYLSWDTIGLVRLSGQKVNLDFPYSSRRSRFCERTLTNSRLL